MGPAVSRLVQYRTFATDSARWEAVNLRAGDVVISTPPKSGTTWMQALCALLIFGGAEFPRPLSELSPWVDICTEPLDSLTQRLETQRHRRFIKTHTPLDGLPRARDVIYVCVGRDPRDVAASWDRHVANTDARALIEARAKAVGLDDIAEFGAGRAEPGGDIADRIRAWIVDDRPPTAVHSSLAATLHHLETFWEARLEPNIVMFHYAELERDLVGQLRRLAHALDLGVDDAVLPRLAGAATFRSMKERAGGLVPEATRFRLWRDEREFFAYGRSGAFRDLFSRELLALYEARSTALASEHLLRWAQASRSHLRGHARASAERSREAASDSGT